MQQWITRLGVGMSPDSASYLRISEGIAAGQGVGFTSPDGEFSTIVHWPPLYPLVLASLSKVANDVRNGGDILQAVLLATNLILLAILTFRMTRSRTAALCCALAAALSVELFQVHVMILSEPLFVALMLGGMLALDSAVRSRSLAIVALAGLLVGLAWLTRYAGVGIVAPCAALVMVFWRPGWLERIRATFIFGIVATGPMATWLIWGFRKTHSVANREFAWYPPDKETRLDGYQTIANWLLPANSSDEKVAPIMALVLGVLVIGSAIWLATVATRPHRARFLPIALLTAALGYVGCLVFSLCFADAYTPLDYRTLLPAMMLALPLLNGATVTMAMRSQLPKALRMTVAIGVVVVLLVRPLPLATWMSDASEDSVGYSSSVWRNMTLMKVVRQLPKTAFVYSNRSDAIFCCTLRPAGPLPRKFDPTRRAAEVTFESKLKRIQLNSAVRETFVVLFRFRNAHQIVDENDLSRRFRLQLIMESPDGAIYRLKSKRRATTGPTTNSAAP